MEYRYLWKPLSLHSLIAANPRISCPSSCTTASSAKQATTALVSRSFLAFTKAAIIEGVFMFLNSFVHGFDQRIDAADVIKNHQRIPIIAPMRDFAIMDCNYRNVAVVIWFPCLNAPAMR